MPPSSSAKKAAQVLPDSRTRDVLSIQTKLLYSNANVGVAVTILAATILGFLQWPGIPHPVIIGWWLYMTLVSIFRWATARLYWRDSSKENRKWRTAFVVGAGLAGIGWGAAAIGLYPEALIHQVYLIFVLGGMMLGAASLLAPRPDAFLAFLLPTGLCPTFRFLTQGDRAHFAMGLLAAAFTIATVITTWRIYRTISSSICLQFVNNNLLEDLQAAKNQTEALNRVLEVRVRDRTAELNRSTEQLREQISERRQVEEQLLRAQRALLESEKLAATARLAATMAHEINNPLAAITNLMFLLAPMQTTPEARAYVVTLEDQIKGLSRITTQMLKFHRDNNQPTEFRLSTVVNEVSEFYGPQAEKKGIAFTPQIETEGPMVGFKGEIVQVTSNLLLNAFDATTAGGQVRLHLYTAPPWLCEVHKRFGYCLTIADSGKGIDRRDRERIFEPFFTTKGDKGTGLGLWVCTGIINRAGGTIRVRSTSRRGRSGTCFSIFLPRDQVTLPAARRRYDQARLNGNVGSGKAPQARLHG